MKKYIVMALCGLSTAAASLVPPTPAFAHSFFIEGAQLVAPNTEKVTGTLGESNLETTVGVLKKVVLKCKKGSPQTNKWTIEKEGKSNGIIFEITGCKYYKIEVVGNKHKLVELAGCKITEPVDLEFTGALTGAPVSEELKGVGAEEPISEIIIKNCNEAEYEIKSKLKGKQACSLPLAEVEMKVHEMVCTNSGSTLKLGVPSAFFSVTVTMNLVTLKEWWAE